MKNRVISADCHLDLYYLPRETFTSRCPAALRERVPRVMTTDDGPVWVGDGTYMGGYAVWMGDEGVAKFYRGRRMREAGFDDEQRRPANPEFRLEDLDRDGISAEVIYGIRFVEDAIKDPVVVDATYRAYNDFITEFCEADPERLIGIGVISAHSPEAAADELRRIGADGLGLRGALFDWFNACEPVWHSMWEPMWEAAEEAEVAISFHIGFGQGTTTVGPKDHLSSDDTDPISVAAHLAVCAMQADEVLASMLVCGALERHSGLKVVMAESHIGWIPYLLQRMDRKFEEGDYAAWSEMRPSDLFRRQVWATFQDDRVGCMLAEEYAPESFCWGSDYPHSDGTWPDSEQFIEETMGGLSGELRDKLVCENVKRLYRLS